MKRGLKKYRKPGGLTHFSDYPYYYSFCGITLNGDWVRTSNRIDICQKCKKAEAKQ